MYDTLSDKQKDIVFEREGKFTVRACPGSGKTYSVAARLAKKISEWDKRNQGIATLSFTNVAWQEIEQQVHKHFGIRQPIPYPHFLGTIDSFINQYIFLPFGHLVMDCCKRPTLVGEPHGNWISGKYERDYDQYFDKTTIDVNGNLIPDADLQQFHFSWKPNKDGSENGHIKNIKKSKWKFWKQGYATQGDANFFSMVLVSEFSSIPKSLIHRFPVFIIDEAQDTSEIQMKIIDSLIENGLEHIVLVGDPDQAIFEWNDAKPQLFTEKFEAWKENSVILNSNRRSSQNICNSTYPLSSLQAISTAVTDDVKEYDFVPEVLTCDLNNLGPIINYFIETCRNRNIEVTPDKVAILYRSKSLFNNITGTPQIKTKALPWILGDTYAKDFAEGKYLYDNVDFKQGFKLIEKACYKRINKSNYCPKSELDKQIERIGFTKYRTKVQEIIKMLPQADGNIGDWMDQANKIFQEENINLRLQYQDAKRNMSFDEIFAVAKEEAVERDYRLGTIHSAKGETFEAVLVILKKKGIGSYYKTMLINGKTVADNEELRIVYVAITRPRKILMIAVPDDENKNVWKNRLFEI
ncbi:MAG: ATP-dependent helicase [Bacteroidales bacterium]|nr:ATP-dependent helicase [Bacteroidales bacterium]